ncbi:MAG TPA: AgmX/PglI C-terminal domain-containing protein [Steroidobacteraceae bacterium]|nr:AgmX/PglI C-terminal domain-containing protein [Steroidobacteraceae bacterium]
MNRFLSSLFATLILLASSHVFAADAAFEQTFDKNKGSLFALYSRALRDNPTIKGRIVFELDIAASGEVTSCLLKSSELNAPVLEARLLARIRQFRFPPRSAPARITKEVAFFPAA